MLVHEVDQDVRLAFHLLPIDKDIVTSFRDLERKKKVREECRVEEELLPFSAKQNWLRRKSEGMALESQWNVFHPS